MKRVRTPTIIQMEAIEAGAAALGIILGYYGKFVPLEQLRIACGVSRDGSLAINMVTAAQKYDLKGDEQPYTLKEIRNLTFPIIINWNVNHFVVVEGFNKKNVCINDPATGPRKITWREFNENYGGKALILTPGPAFKKEGKPKPLIGSILSRFKGCKGPLLYLFLAGLFLLVPGIALPSFTRYFVDQILIKKLTSAAPLFIFALFLTICTTVILTSLQGYFLARLNGKISIRLSSHFLWHILRLPVEFYAERHGGEIAYRLTINDKVVATLTEELARAFINLILIVAYGTLMFFYDPLIACIGIAAGVLNLAILYAINRVRTDANIRLQQDMGKRVGVAIGGLQNIETLKAIHAESDFFARWAGYYAKTINSVQEIGKLDIYLSIIPPVTQFLVASLVLTLGGIRVIEGEMTLGMLLGLQTLMQTFLTPITRFIYLGQRIQNVRGGLYRLDDVLSNPIDPRLAIEKKEGPLQKLRGELQIKKINFGYNPLTPPLIKDFDLHILPGQSVAIIGPSGCGKTTIARLVAGLYQPWSGEILFDGQPIDRIGRPTFCRSVAAVDQRIFLFGGTIRENLTLWDDTLPEDDMIQGAVDAQIHGEIIKRAEGYESEVLEGGANFSGGQIQCLEIARALAINPSLIVFDEATSSLDSETEIKILKKIRQRGCACLIIAHRLSTIRDCDEIVILQRGEVISRGTHLELKSSSPIYQEFIQLEGVK
jgi:NHLM bacteriocin system ABC transporter peptidase/ATP-binding protein